MSIWLTIKVSFRALIRAPLRALLTLLGIVIGIGAVLAMVALGEGTRAGIEASLSSLGSNLVTVLAGAQLAGGSRGQGILLNENDAAAMTKLPSLRAVAPVLRGSAQMVAGPRNWSTTVAATTPEYLEVRSWQLESGSFFTQSEYRNAAKVCVLGKITAQNLFGEDDPIGQKIRANKMTCEVIGVLEAKGGSAMGQDQDDTLVVPLTTYRTRMSPIYARYVSMILASAVSAEASSQLSTEIEALMRQRHRLQEGDDSDFTIRDLKELAKAASEQTKILSFLLGGIASISLLVGGIGIMNIMLVSVTERTREIGIRMAVGAKSRDIMAQFLAESLILSLVGGALGIGLGMGAAAAFEKMIGWQTAISSSMIALAVGVACGVGVVFGLAPAWKAAKLDPIDALRHE
jgi:putative ABC transport system permease protein